MDRSPPKREPPAWFVLNEALTPDITERLLGCLPELELPVQVRSLPMMAHWFIVDSLSMANKANRMGSHAVALALTRQCIEALSVVEVGLANHPDTATVLLAWEADRKTPGEMRKWLSANVWPTYGAGLWQESWPQFMAELAGAIQPYAHYSAPLSQWQTRLTELIERDDEGNTRLFLEIRPRAYDPQKATRITLFHSLLFFTMARVWLAHRGTDDKQFAKRVQELGDALGRSAYLDGHQTNWRQQFWAMVYSTKDGPILE